MNLDTIWTAVAAKLKPVIDNSYPEEPGNPVAPCIWPSIGQVDYHVTPNPTIDLVVVAMVGLQSSKKAQQDLRAMIDDTGTKSVKAALEAEPTLGGTISDLAVMSCSGFKVYTVAGTPYLGAEFTVQVLT